MAAEGENSWKFAQCFGDKGEVEDITEGNNNSSLFNLSTRKRNGKGKNGWTKKTDGDWQDPNKRTGQGPRLQTHPFLDQMKEGKDRRRTTLLPFSPEQGQVHSLSPSFETNHQLGLTGHLPQLTISPNKVLPCLQKCSQRERKRERERQSPWGKEPNMAFYVQWCIWRVNREKRRRGPSGRRDDD
jgi:hypothetical protein